MLLTQLKNYVFTTRIDLGDGEYIELREPTQKELIGFSDNDEKNAEMLSRLFPVCIIDSSIFCDNEEKATGKEIYDNLKESGSMMSEIISIWMESIPFQHRLMKSEKSGK